MEGANISKRRSMIETVVTFISTFWQLLSVSLHDVRETKAIMEILINGAWCLLSKLEIVSGLLL